MSLPGLDDAAALAALRPSRGDIGTAVIGSTGALGDWKYKQQMVRENTEHARNHRHTQGETEPQCTNKYSDTKISAYPPGHPEGTGGAAPSGRSHRQGLPLCLCPLVNAPQQSQEDFQGWNDAQLTDSSNSKETMPRTKKTRQNDAQSCTYSWANSKQSSQ